MTGRDLAAPVKLPAAYRDAKRALALCSNVDECKGWSNKAVALASYAKQAKDTELSVFATRIKDRATRRMGELLKELDAQGKRTDQLTVGAHGKLTQREAAANAGLSEHQQLQAVRVANVPKDELERLIESKSPPSVTALAEIGKRKPNKPARKTPPAAPEDADYQRLLTAFRAAPIATRQRFLKTHAKTAEPTNGARAAAHACTNERDVQAIAVEIAAIVAQLPDGDLKLLIEKMTVVTPDLAYRLRLLLAKDGSPWL